MRHEPRQLCRDILWVLVMIQNVTILVLAYSLNEHRKSVENLGDFLLRENSRIHQRITNLMPPLDPTHNEDAP